MIIPIKCWTCNKVIADKYDYFVKNSNDEVEDHNKKLLDSMGLKRPCCRMHMISTVDLMEII